MGVLQLYILFQGIWLLILILQILFVHLQCSMVRIDYSVDVDIYFFTEGEVFSLWILSILLKKYYLI